MKTQQEWPPLADIFALVEPQSAAAMDILTIKQNRHLLVNATMPNDENSSRSLDNNARLALRLDFALFFCRRAISFGSSRANDILLPPAPDIDKRQFQLRLDPQSAELILYDQTSGRTKLEAWTKSSEHTHLPSSHVVFGDQDRYILRIVAVWYRPGSITLRRLLSECKQTTGARTATTQPKAVLFTLISTVEEINVTKKRHYLAGESDVSPPLKRRRFSQKICMP